MRSRLCMGLAGLLLVVVGWPRAQAQAPAACQPGPDAIGLVRTIDIDTTNGPSFGTLGRDILRDHEVVLTFDDGPHARYTRPILDALDAHCTKATFFMVGLRALTQSGLVREVARRGHSIGTHTWSHKNLTQLDAAGARTEIELGISSVQRALGSPTAPFFRFPYLAYPHGTVAYLKSRNTAMFGIDIDSVDYRTRSPTAVVHNVMQQLAVRHKGIILMHDIQPSTAGAIKTLLAKLKAEGYGVVHLRPSQGQVTVAEFDRRIERDYAGRRVASLPVPVAQRGVVAPAWEVDVKPTSSSARTNSMTTGSGGGNWLSNIFRGW